MSWAEMVVNVKEWQDGHSLAVEHLFPGLHAVCEEVGTLEGSGCGAIHVLSSLDLNEHSKSASLALLGSDDNSRLWGISVASGFTMGLVHLFGRSLMEQTIRQCADLAAQGTGLTNCHDLPTCPK
jgi:hypothetical protein